MVEGLNWGVDRAREDWLFAVCGQLCLLTTHIIVADEIEEALEKVGEGEDEQALKKYLQERQQPRMQALVQLNQVGR